MQNTEFTKEMEEKSGERVSTCYQCYRCTNGVRHCRNGSLSASVDTAYHVGRP